MMRPANPEHIMPYEATQKTPVNIHGMQKSSSDLSVGGHMETGSTKPMKRPSKSTAKGSMVEGPYGGKKPQS